MANKVFLIRTGKISPERFHRFETRRYFTNLAKLFYEILFDARCVLLLSPIFCDPGGVLIFFDSARELP
ncbi:MAG: hypothetical protein C0403_12720 [Desulfobacterium sp.]|nr:hypothetical protein [Desulfobacterium sp.]